MGFKFQNLPVNTLVGASWSTFKGVCQGRTVDKNYKTKYYLKVIQKNQNNTILLRLGCTFLLESDSKESKQPRHPFAALESPIHVPILNTFHIAFFDYIF